uniref:Spectrin repeat containing nuclear envelope protein 2 n=1 Tax=Anser brachyrhynchus TaxID=132585 RepID=A0A8B9BV85_9AVES
KTFTTWINSILSKHIPPSVISDLYTDIQQGHMLLDLLEVLSGQHLPREKGFNTFQCRSNIENALTFLRSKSLKLINIHVADIIEGKPSIVLGLIWTIIFHFHIEELARTLACTYNQPSLDCSNTVDSSPKASRSAKKSAKIKERWKISATKALLLWAKDQCSLVTDFKSSWRSGLPFLAIINALRPGLVDLEKAKARSNKENLDEAFRIAELELNIPRLLEPEDIDITNPDEKSIMTYVAQFLQYSRNMPETEDMQVCREEMMSFMEAFNQEKKAFLPLLSSKRSEAELSEGQQQMREEWSKLVAQVRNISSSPCYQCEHVCNTCFTNSNTLLDYHYGLCSAIANEVMLKLNIWNMKYGTKESVESLLENWNNFVEEKRLETQLETATHICEDLKNKNISSPGLEISKLFKMVESKISMCRDYISNVNTTLQKVLSSWSNYTENLHLLKTWLEEKRNDYPKETPAEILASWNSVHGSLNEAGNYLIEVSKEQVRSNIAKELKKLNRRWAKFIKRTHFVSHQCGTWPRMFPGNESEFRNLNLSCLLPNFPLKKLLQKQHLLFSKKHTLMLSSATFWQICKSGECPCIHPRKGDRSPHMPFICALYMVFICYVKSFYYINKLLLVLFIFLYGAFLQEAFNALDNKVLDKFLKAAEQLKNISSDHEKLVVEEKSKDENPLSVLIRPGILEKQFFCKEKKLLSMDKTKGLIKEHEVPDPFLFCSPTSLSECIVCPSCSCFHNIQCCSLCLWKFVLEMINICNRICLFYMAVLASKSQPLPCSFKLEVILSLKVIASFFSYNTKRSNLEELLQISREKVASVFTDEIKDTSCLQNKLHELQVSLHLLKTYLMPELLFFRVEPSPSMCYECCQGELQRSILNQIEVCKQLEHLDSSARDEFNPIDLQAASKIMFYYQNQLEEMSHKMQIRETVLKDLEAFMASLRKIQSSIRRLTDSSGQPEIQGKALREAAQEVSHMAKEAKCLDERLKAVDICLEDAECGGETWCEKLVLNLSEELTVTCGHSSDQMLTEENDLYKIFSTRNCELLKNIQDLRDRINKIGLKDPTIPAIQQRVKSLMELEKELDCAAVEMKSMREITNKLLQMKEEKAEEANEQCRVTERLWEDTKLLLAECQEQCARALELLKQYQSCKSSLTSIIQKLEIVLSQQNSYMGKENLNRLITKIEEAKEEFHDHSEDVDKINQICKNLQFQLNKMRSFEEPPFENEANIIVDRWLDINEKTENYCDNLGRAQALWDKLLNLSGTIDAWANAELKNIEDHCLTEEDLTQLQACLRVQEQKLQKFDNTVAEIEELLNSNEPPLELQVGRSFYNLLSMKRPTSELAVNTAELKGDLDLAKTQIGMTESLLKALSPSDTLEIFTKLEEIHQKILQQKHHVTLLQEETDCPDVDELNKQLKCVTDLFNKKKDVFQDHFIGVLNRQCKNFNDWFSSTQLSLKDCFEPSETKQVLEERQKVGGDNGDIQEVKTLLNKVKHYLPKASINQLNSRVRDQEAELQRLISKCQKQEKEVGASLQQYRCLRALPKEDSNSLREAGLTEDGTISETSGLISRYHTLVTSVSEMAGNSQGLPVEGQNFEELAQDMSSWIKRLEKAVNSLRSQESELPPDERSNQIKEITALKNAGDVKIQSMVALGEMLMRNEKIKKPEVQQTISELKNQWESTCQLATEYRSPQEQLQLTREQYEQSKESLRLALNELKKEQQEMGFALQPGLQEKQAQLTSYAHLLQKAEELTSQFNELESQDHLQGCTENPYFTEESWLELKHQHENLLSQLQTTVQTLERHVQEHQQFQDMVTGLSTELKTLSEKLADCGSPEQQAPLSRFEDTLKKILVLAETVKQSTSSPGQKFIKDEIETLQSEHRSLEERLENVKQKEENIFSEALELKDELADEIQMEDKTDTMLEREIQVTSDTPVATEESFTTVEFKERLEMHNVSIVLTVMTVEDLLKRHLSLKCLLYINLQTELETWKAKSLCLSQEACPNATGSNSAELQTPEPVVPCWDRLLQELDAVKAVKQQQYSLVNEYQKNLSAAQSSMKNLSTEKDNIKMGPMNNTVLLEKIKACVQALHKERDVLNQLKAQQESLSQHLTCMDKVLTASQMRQLEQWWQHMEQTVQKKHDQVVAEINEFNVLMNKARDIQKLIQEQYLQTELRSSAGEKANYPVVWTTELQDIKHGLSLLKRRIELQMKRIWSDQEKVALENCIHDLQSKLEALSEQRTPQEDVQVTGPALKKQEMMNKLKENISWVKDSLSSLDQKAALFPSDVKSQIRNCQLMRTEVLDREPVIESMDKELQHIIPNLKPEEISDMTFLLQALQNSYKALVLKSVQRLQQLELQLEERQRLTAEIEKVHCQLRNAETLARLDTNQTSTWSELVDQQAILKEILKDIQEIDGLISSHCKESQVTAGELSLSEQLFLIDQLRSLKNRARKTQRQIQNKCHEVGKKIAVYREFAEGITSLQQDLNDLQCGEVNLEDKLLGATQEVKNKCKALKEKVLCFQSNLSQMMKYKEIFECIGLNWDSQQLDELHELQTQFLKIKNKIKGKLIHFDNVVREWDNLHSLLNEIWTMTSTVRKEASKLNDSSSSSSAENLISAQILLQTVQQILYLTQEVENQINKNEVFDTPFKESKRQEIKSLEKDVEELIQLLQNLISSLQCVNKEDIQNEVEHIFHAIKHIQLELQQPLLVDMKMMQFEKMRWEAIQNMMTAEFSAIKYLMEKERENEEEKSLAADIETKLKTLQDHELQLKTDITARSALQDACKTGELYTEAVQKAAKFLEDYEAQVYSATAGLGSSDEACQTPQWKQEGFDSAMADVEKLNSKLKKLVKPEDKINLENTLRELVNKSLALREKILVSNIDSAEDDLVKLRQISGELMRLHKGHDRALGRIVTALWENWLGLLESAKELEINCEELKQEWKFINEELERETIILDKLQEEQPESLKEKEKATREELVELLDFVNSFEENINRQQLLLLLLLHRIKNILNTSENTEAEAVLPALCEIKTMQDRCKKLYEKTQDHKDLVQSEIQERSKISEEISAVKNALQNAASMLDQDAGGKAGQLEEVRSVIGKESQTLKDIMEKLRIKYSEMYTIVPAEIEAQLEECKKTLQDLEDKVSFEILQSSPEYVLKRKAETINNGLQAIEKMLQQKSENIAKAKEVQKQIWDMLDLWHYKLNELDAEVHDIVEQDSCHAQELMDILVTPLQQYQQVSQLAERRTAILNKAASKMEEYDELLKNMKVWIENTNCLLREDAQNDTAKSLHKYSDDLQMALEDSEQKQNLLHNVYLELEELTTVFETDSVMQQLNEADDQVATLQHEIAEILPQIQHVADELGAIESHVKVFEKDIVKMKTILSSEDLLEFSPKDQLKHGQVILDHVGPMQKTIVHIQSYEDALQLPGVKIQPFSVFRKARQLLRELKKLEKITKEKNELLEEALKKTEECEQEIEKRKQFLKNHLVEISHENQPLGEMEAVKEEIIKLCQRKEDILTGMKNSMSELHQCLQQEVPDLGDEPPASVFPQTDSIGTNTDVSFWPSEKDGENHKEDSANSWSSGTLSDGVSQVTHSGLSPQDNCFFSCALLQSDTPPVLNATRCSPGKTGDSEEAVDGGRPEPETILQVCQAQVAELEQWLDKTKVSLGSDPQTPKMQQMVELQLGNCQVMLSEIEQKVLSLLEDCGNSAGHQQETEALSLKLKEVKCNLEKVQMMLQDKYNEEQSNTVHTIDFTVHSVLCSQDLKVKAAEQKNLIDFIESCVEKMQLQFEDSMTQKLEPSKRADPTLSPKDQTGNKWQYLQQELSSKMKSPLYQLVEPQITTKLNMLPRGMFASTGTPTVEELKTYTVQLGDLSQEANVVHAQVNMALAEEVSSNLDRKLFELLLAISRCLNNMEEMLNTSVLSTEEAAVQQVLYETLSIELQKLHADLSDKKDDLLKSITCAGGSTDVFCECFSNLQARLEQTQAATASRSNSMKAGLDHNSNYQNEVRLLYDQLTEKKATLQQCLNAICGHNVSEQLQRTDACALELQNFENQVAKLRGYGERFQLPITLIQEVYKLEDVLDDMWRILKAKYVELNPPSISENQYEDLLRGFAELVAIGQEKVAQDAKQLTKSRVALQSHLENHKDFFHNLMTHMAFMQAFSEKVSPSILQKREKFWRELVNEVRLLEQKASQYGIHLESLLKEWTEFDDECLAFSKELEAVNSTLPSVNLVEETEERLIERIALLQQIKSSVDGKHARLYQMVKEGKKLLTAVSCPEIASQIRKLEEQWLSLTKKIGNELHRLQTLLQLLVSYNRDSEELMKWLDSAQQRMNFWKEQSLSVSQDLTTIRDNINSLFTFSKEVDEKSSLKSSVVSTANQLFHVKQADTAALRSSLAKFEQKWGELITQLPAIQEKLYQLQMEKLSSREAIAELMTWLDHVEQKGHEEPVNSQSSAARVRSLLQKYKEYMMEMNFKQWMVDFVNQSLLQMSTCDVESKRYERTEFAECLGEMNLRWHRLQASLSRKIQDLEHLLEDITENENKAQTLRNWLEAQSDRLRSLQTPESLISAQNTLDDCKDLENQLATKSKMLDELKQTVALNGSAEQTPEAAPFRIAELCEMRDNVVSQVAQLKTSMQSILEQWRVYDEIHAEVSLMMTRYLYCIDQCKPSVLSLEALKKQVKTLQSLQDELENSEESWAKFQVAASDLKKNCSPSFADIIDQKCTEANTRWSSVNEDITDQLRTAQVTLQLWEPFDILCTEAAAKLQQHEEQCTQLLDAHMPEDNLVETLKQRIQDIKVHECFCCLIQASMYLQKQTNNHNKANKSKEHLLFPLPTLSPPKLQPLQRASYLEKMLQRKLDEFEVFILVAFNLPFYFQNHTLELAALSPSIESLNEASIKLPLSDFTLKKMQSLTRQWSQKTATALELCRSEFVHEGTQNDEKKFFQKCENWIKFLEKMKEALKTNIPGRFEELQEQQRVYEVKRTEFISKLTLLKEQWQNVIRLVQQRKKDIDGLVSQWQIFRSSLQSLSRFLADTNSFLLAVKSQDCYSLYHLRNLIQDFKSKAVILQRWQGMYSSVIDVGEKLRIDSDPETSAVIQEELSQLQQNWGDTQVQLEKMKMKLSSVLQSWNCCEKQTKELESRLRELKDEIKDPLPVENEELYKAKEHMKELEQSLADWAHNMKELRAMKVELAHCILTEDMMVLKEQVEHLHRQWEELCLRVSLRKQEIEDRLNAWIVFNEKNKELCSWLVQMESKVLQTADVSIEDMIDKLQKDCMEEINLFSENKLHLKQMGDQLIKASNKTRVAEIDDKLNKINDRWQHLFDVIGARVKKLKETFAFIQLLDKNMSNLRTWLARIESELSKPVVYDICDDQEIQKRLAEQQDLQRDIEQHTAGVESVFNICEVLLHDSDACANETECDSIQQTSRSLDRRWRNICAMSMERRMKIEETWRLWQRFLDDYSRFEDWLKSAERTAASPNSSEVLYTHAKEELKKFEAFQRQVHERLTQLELINKQYRRLARENRTDSASKLKQMVHEGNQRWDNLQKRVAAILRRLKHFTNRRDEFEATRENILVWLTEMDLQLTNVEHFSKSNFDDKMRQLNGFQQEITLHTNKIDQLIVFGEQLIQKSEPLDATLIEDELEELHRYCQEVFGRVARFHQRLTSRHPGLDDEKETSENETDPEDSREIQNDLWHKKAIGDGPSSPQSLCHLMPPTQGHERSGCETPVSVDSIPLEWDHTGDVGGSSSHEDEEEATYYSALSGKSVSEAHPWHSPDSPVCRKHRYSQAEMVGNVLSGPETSTPYKPGYVSWRLCGTSVNKENIASANMSDEEFLVLSLVGIIDRWELIQAQDLRNKLRMKQNLQQWQQLNSDLSDVSAWLDKTEEELEELQKAKPPTSMHAMEQRVKKLKDMLKAFDNYKAVVLSVNLSSKEFQKAESTEFKELQNRLRKVNLRWEKATHALDNWRKGLQQALLHCQVSFHILSVYKHILKVESSRSLHWFFLFVCKQLEKELLEQQPKVNSLQELCAYLLLKSDGEDYIEAEEKVHVIGKKLKQLIEQVSHDLKTIQGNLDTRAFLPVPDDLDSGAYHPVTVKSSPPVKKATESHPQPTKVVPRSPSFFYRVLRAALPLQLFFLLLLLLACMIPSSEEDYSCTQANNFARSFYPMLRYTNGPPPT